MLQGARQTQHAKKKICTVPNMSGELTLLVIFAC